MNFLIVLPASALSPSYILFKCSLHHGKEKPNNPTFLGYIGEAGSQCSSESSWQVTQNINSSGLLARMPRIIPEILIFWNFHYFLSREIFHLQRLVGGKPSPVVNMN